MVSLNQDEYQIVESGLLVNICVVLSEVAPEPISVALSSQDVDATGNTYKMSMYNSI